MVLLASPVWAIEDYVIGGGVEADSSDGLSGAIFADVGLTEKTHLYGSFGKINIPLPRDIDLNTYYGDVGLDHWFKPVGVRAEVAYWGDNDIFDSIDFRGAVYWRNDKVSLSGVLDFLADLSLLTFLAVGLYLAGAIPGMLLWLLVVRYPLLLIGVIILYFARGPAPLAPTLIGRATTFATSILLLVIALKLSLPTTWPPSLWIQWSLWSLYLLIAANILYLFYCGFAWTGLGKNRD